MTKYEVRHGMDPETVLGVISTEGDVVKSYTPSEGEPERFGLAVKMGMEMYELQGRWRNYVFAPAGGEVKKDAEVEITSGEIAKTDDEKQMVFGWAYVTHDKDGELNIDKSGDFADDVEDVEKTAYNYVLSSRQGDADHTNIGSSTMVESMMFTPDKIEKMGLPAGVIPTGWWVGFKIEDAAVWDRVKKGELKAFSIHGKGTRSKVEE